MKTLPVVTEKKVPISRQYVSADGWNTWDTSSMLSFVHMPEAFQIRLSILDRSENIPVRDKIFVSCLDESPITVRTEPRSWDGSMCCMDIYRRSPDLSYLQDIFPVLLRWNEWFSENRMTPEGYLSWGSGPAVKQYGKKYEAYGVHTTEGATYESGMDLASIYADVPFCEETSTMYLADMALMGIYVTDCRALLEMAVLLGEDGSRIRQRMQLVERAIRSMWNESMGVYANLRLDTGKFSKAVGPTCFCALFADGIPKENAGRMILEWLLPETRLGGTYPLPTVSRDDVGFTPEKTLFRGRIWPPVCYLAFRALRRGGFTKEASSVSERLLNMFLKEWREHRHIHCNHDPATGSGELPASVAYYTWGALYAYMAWEERNS